MKLAIAKDQLLLGLQAVQNVAGARTTLPILSNILLRAFEGRLHLTATDLDMTVSCSVPANIAEEGAVTVPGRKFFGIVRELVVADVELEADDKSAVVIRSGGSYFKINGLSANDYPPSRSSSRPEPLPFRRKSSRRCYDARPSPCPLTSPGSYSMASFSA